MVTINMPGAKVKNQYIAETMNFGDVQTRNDLIDQFKQLKSGLHQAIEDKAVPVEAEGLIEQAIVEAGQAKPDKNILVEYLSSAKDMVSGVGGLASAITTAISAVGLLFQ